MSKVIVETVREVFEAGESAYHWRVGPDGDGLGCAEVAYLEGEKVMQSMSMSPAVARRVAECLLKCADELEVAA